MDRGDKVLVVMASNSIFEFQRAPQFYATLQWTPAGPGDTFELILDDGTEISLNGNSQDFVALVKANDGEGE